MLIEGPSLSVLLVTVNCYPLYIKSPLHSAIRSVKKYRQDLFNLHEPTPPPLPPGPRGLNFTSDFRVKATISDELHIQHHMKTRTGSNGKRLIYENMGKKVKVYFLQTRGSPKRISLVRLRFDTLGPVL